MAHAKPTSPRTRRVLSREQAREVDRHAIEDLGIPSIVLMENAARGAAEVAQRMVRGVPRARVVVVCGTGNNGGDGFAVARHLALAGWRVRAVLVGEAHRLTEDARTNHDVLVRMGVEVPPFDPGARGFGRCDLVIDAIFGTGLTRAVEGVAARAIERINAARARGTRVLAIDVPSGMDADTGEVLGAAVEADATVTFVAMKRGLATRAGKRRTGRVVVAGIGAPA